MKIYSWITVLLFSILVIAVVVISIVPKDINDRITAIDRSVLGLLKEKGLSDNDLVSANEEEWADSESIGRTVFYKFNVQGKFNKEGLYNALKENLKVFKNVYLKNFVINEDKNELCFKVMLKNRELINMSIYGVGEKIKGKIAVVLDDFGYTNKNLPLLNDIKDSLTLAVLPGLPYSSLVNSMAKDENREIILHLPLEPENENLKLEKETILVTMSDEEIKKIIKNALDSVNLASGVSNHMGSKATKDERVLAVVLSELKKKDLFFLDSYTSGESVCSLVAENIDMRCVRRDIFIDNDLEEEAVIKQLKKAADIAKTHGKCIAIGHDRKVTIQALGKAIPGIKDENIKFVKLSELINEK